MGLPARIFGNIGRIFGNKAKTAAEGEYRPGPYLFDGGWLSATAGRYMNWWQAGYSVQPYGEGSAMVEACVSAYAQTTAMCATEGSHWAARDDGGRTRVTTSSLSRILRHPNDYQSISDFLLNLTRRLYTHGEAFAYVTRNSRNEIDSIHLMRDGWVLLGTDGSIFYFLSGNEIIERRVNLSGPVPARDVLHVRLHTPRHALKGVSPILATALDLAMSGAALNQQIAFYLNQARPSFMLETDQELTADQTRDLRKLWNEQTQGENAGGTPILTWGLKAKPVTTAAKDGALADLLKMSDQNVALAFRMPLQVLGIGTSVQSSTEQLMQSWIATGLGFCLNHIEEAFGLLFRLEGYPNEYLEFDTKALLRSSFKEMMEALSVGTRRVMTSNEAREMLELPAKEGGDELLVQIQDIPMSLAGLKTAGTAPSAAAPDPAQQDPAKSNPYEDDDGDSEPDGRGFADFTRQIDDLTAVHAQRLH